jgi:MoaA/NifB/PqqE/SkfB family radical SAM enzyme
MLTADSSLYKTACSVYRTLRLYGSNRSFRAWRVLVLFLVRRIFGRVAPPFVYLAVTTRCQCRCVHCYANAPIEEAGHDLDKRQFRSAIDQIARLGAIGIVFTGGEPLLYEDLPDLIQHAHALGLLARIDTNGLLLDEGHVSALKRAGVAEVCVSIDDADPEVHDRLRNHPGAFRKAIEGLENLRRYAVPCQIFTYVARRTIVAGLKRIIDLARRQGVFCIQMLFPLATGRWEGAYDQVLTEREKALVRTLKGRPFIHFVSPGPKAFCEICTKATLHVSANGDVNPCPAAPFALGNLKASTLSEIWERHCRKLNLAFRGECPLNHPRTRETLEKYARSVAGDAGRLETSKPSAASEVSSRRGRPTENGSR